MTDLSDFAITKKWPAAHPDRLQLYSLPTPNGVKVSIALEETGLPYEPHLVRFDANDQMSPEFLSLNPNNKIPAIVDPHGPGGQPLALFESGAILVYLAGKTGRLMPADDAGRYQVLQWVMFQMGGIGPMFGQLGFFNKFAGKDYEDKRPRDRYVAESRRLLAVLDKHLDGREWIMGVGQVSEGDVPRHAGRLQRRCAHTRGRHARDAWPHESGDAGNPQVQVHPAPDVQARGVRRGHLRHHRSRAVRHGRRQGLRVQHGGRPAHPGRGRRGEMSQAPGPCSAVGGNSILSQPGRNRSPW